MVIEKVLVNDSVTGLVNVSADMLRKGAESVVVAPYPLWIVLGMVGVVVVLGGVCVWWLRGKSETV